MEVGDCDAGDDAGRALWMKPMINGCGMLRAVHWFAVVCESESVNLSFPTD